MPIIETRRPMPIIAAGEMVAMPIVVGEGSTLKAIV
jgi:hypothetical protein